MVFNNLVTTIASFICHKGQYFMALLVYVDDLLIIDNSEAKIIKFKKTWDTKFTIKDIRAAKYFLGLEISITAARIYVNQRKCILDIVKDVNLLGTKPKSVPFPRRQRLCSIDSPLIADPQHYRTIMGILLYLGFIRSDLAYSV